jgi:hypothetical protein
MSSIAQTPLQSKAPGYAWFDANAVATATLLGTPLAGASLMALNYLHLGQGMKAAATLLIGLVITSLAILVGWNLPSTASASIALVLLIGIRKMAEVTQGSAVKAQVSEGGRVGSKWIAFLVGGAFLALLFGVIFFGNLASFRESKVSIGAKDEVFYSGSATKEQALALGKKLKETGYLTDRGVSVFFDQEPNARILSFVVKEGSWTQPALVSSFEEIARQAAPSIGGFPVQVRLMDKQREVKTEGTVGKVNAGGDDTIYYFGTATQAEAQALGKELKSKGFFQGRGADVFLLKDNEGVTLSFVVRDGISDDSAVVSEFEKTVRNTASAVGGLPIRLRLVNPSLEVKKEQWVK